MIFYLAWISNRNIWNEDNERIGRGRYCERSDNVSLMHHNDCPTSKQFILLILFWLYCYHRFVFKIKMPPAVRVQLINDLADIEYVMLSYSFTCCFPSAWSDKQMSELHQHDSIICITKLTLFNYLCITNIEL